MKFGRQIVLYALLPILAACRAGPNAEVKDIVSIGERGAYLYFVENDTISRTKCREGTSLYNMANCSEDRASVAKERFSNAFTQAIVREIPAKEQLLEEIYVKLIQVDTALFEASQQQGDFEEPPALRQRINDAEVDLAAVNAEIADLNIEIARILQFLGSRDSADLRQQMEAMQNQKFDLINEQEAIRRELHQIRREFVDAHLRQSENRMARRLQMQRDVTLEKLDQSQKELETLLLDASSINYVMSMLSAPIVFEVYSEDARFAYEWGYLKKFGKIFADFAGEEPIVIPQPQEPELEEPQAEDPEPEEPQQPEPQEAGAQLRFPVWPVEHYAARVNAGALPAGGLYGDREEWFIELTNPSDRVVQTYQLQFMVSNNVDGATIKWRNVEDDEQFTSSTSTVVHDWQFDCNGQMLNGKEMCKLGIHVIDSVQQTKKGTYLLKVSFSSEDNRQQVQVGAVRFVWSFEQHRE